MNSQLYTAASGLLAEERRLELIANNLANTSTPGFRPLRSFSAVYQKFGPEAPAATRTANAGVAVAGTFDLALPGPLVVTGRDLDVALQTGNYLAVETAAGRRYTRAGALEVDPGGYLVDAGGRRVLGADGRPIGGLGAEAGVGGDGRVFAKPDGVDERGRLLVVSDPRNALRREGSNLLVADGGEGALATVAEPEIRARTLEGSAVRAIEELTQLIEAQRAFESYQKIVSLTMNEVNRRTVNDIAG